MMCSQMLMFRIVVPGVLAAGSVLGVYNRFLRQVGISAAATSAQSIVSRNTDVAAQGDDLIHDAVSGLKKGSRVVVI